MTQPYFSRNHIYVNLISILFNNGDESYIQNFYPPSEEKEGYSYDGIIWHYFPFELQSLSSSLDFDSLSSKLKIPNVEDLNRVWETKLTRSNFTEYLEDAELEIIYLFLNPDEPDTEHPDSFKPYDPPVVIKSVFNVNSLSFSPGVINLNLQNPLNSVDQSIPGRHFSGKYFRQLPLDNSPRFTSGISYD